MVGHKICFYGEIWLIIPKLSMLPLLIWNSGCDTILASWLFHLHHLSHIPTLAQHGGNIKYILYIFLSAHVYLYSFFCKCVHAITKFLQTTIGQAA